MSDAPATDSLEQQLELGTDIMRRIPDRGQLPLPLGDVLHVPTGHVVALVHDGKVADVLGSGAQRLIPRVLPQLDATGELRDPETDEPIQVAFVALNRRTLDKRWGTRHPLMVRDAECGPLRLRGYGGYSFRLTDAGRFVHAMLGQQGIYETEQVENFLRDVIVARLNVEAGELSECIGELSASTGELVRRARHQLVDDFERYGLELIDVKLHALILPDQAHALLERHAAQAQSTESVEEPRPIGHEIDESDAPRSPALARVELASTAGVATLLPKMHVQTLPEGDEQQANDAENAVTSDGSDVGTPADAAAGGAARSCDGCSREAPTGASFCPWCGQTLGGDA